VETVTNKINKNQHKTAKAVPYGHVEEVPPLEQSGG